MLSNGLGEISASWARITARSARPPGSAPTTAPDRAGATTPHTPRTASPLPRDLHTLLAAAGETGPYVLVGHSTGGTYAMTYAARYPEQVAGMVLLDSSSPDQLTKVARLRRPVRRDAPRPRAAAHPGPRSAWSTLAPASAPARRRRRAQVQALTSTRGRPERP